MSREPDDVSAVQPPGAPDDVDDQLAAYDEQLRSGHVPNPSDPTVVANEANPETSSLFRCLNLLERTWPRATAAEATTTSRQIGRFQLEKMLGVGGFGIVYKAYDPLLRREVALKIPRLHSLASDKLRERIEREARAAASLDHPNIVPIYEAGHAGPVCYIAAAYCPGPNLAEWLKAQKAPVPVRIAASLIRTLAIAVHYSHSRGVLHRDLKPSNVMLVTDDIDWEEPVVGEFPFVPRLTDFGLAKLLEGNAENATVNAETIALGTPAYMAPEQTRQLESPIGPATDVYGLGVVLYELLTGRPPFVATNVADLFDQIRSDEPVAPHRLRREISRDLETICLRCLEKNPTSRFRTAKDLADDLGRTLLGEPIASRPVAIHSRILRWCRRKPTTAALIGVSIGAIVTIVGLLAAYSQNLAKYNDDISQLNDDLAQAARNAKSMQRIAEVHERQAKDSLYAADINRVVVARKEKDTPAMTELLERHRPQPGELDRRGFEWWYLYPQANRARRELLEVRSAVYVLCPSPDRQWIAAVGQDATVRLLDSTTEKVSKEFPTGQIEINSVAFSPDGKELATAGDDGTIRICNSASGHERLNFRAHTRKAFQVIYTPDCGEIISCGDDPVIRVFDARSGEERRQLMGHNIDVQFLALATDGRTFASTSSDHTIRRWDLRQWTSIGTYVCDEPVGCIVLRDERDLMIVASDMGSLRSFKISTGREVSRVNDFDRTESLALHPDGTLLAAGNRAGRIRFWNLDPEGEFTESPIAPWQAHRGSVNSLVWSADGSQLISTGQDGRILSWNRSMIESPNLRSIDFAAGSRFCIIPETDHLLTVQGIYGDRQLAALTVFNWHTGTQVARIDGPGFHEVAASRDGRFVASLKDLQDQEELHLFQVQNSSDSSFGLSKIAHWSESGELARVRFSPDSKSIAVSRWYQSSPQVPEEHFVWLLDVPDFKQTKAIPIPHAKVMAFSPDSKRIVLGTQTGLKLWDIENRRIVWQVRQTDLNDLIFSPDGRLVVTGGNDRIVTVRDSITGLERFRLAGHRQRITSLAFTPDARTLASGDVGGIVKLWNVVVGQELLEFNSPGTIVQDVEFSTDGKHMLLLIRKDGDRGDILQIYDAIGDRN